MPARAPIARSVAPSKPRSRNSASAASRIRLLALRPRTSRPSSGRSGRRLRGEAGWCGVVGVVVTGVAVPPRPKRVCANKIAYNLYRGPGPIRRSGLDAFGRGAEGRSCEGAPGGGRTRRRKARLLASSCRSHALLSHDLDQHPLLAAPVELAVEDLLPGPKVELPAGNCHDDFAAHHLPLEMGVTVVFAGAVVVVGLGTRIVRGELFEPALVVLVQAGLVVVDENARGDVHGVHKTKSFPYAALAHGRLDLPGDVHEIHPLRDVEQEDFAVALHRSSSSRRSVSRIRSSRKRRRRRMCKMMSTPAGFTPSSRIKVAAIRNSSASSGESSSASNSPSRRSSGRSSASSTPRNLKISLTDVRELIGTAPCGDPVGRTWRAPRASTWRRRRVPWARGSGPRHTDLPARHPQGSAFLCLAAGAVSRCRCPAAPAAWRVLRGSAPRLSRPTRPRAR